MGKSSKATIGPLLAEACPEPRRREELRCKILDFLLARNQHDNEKIARLSAEEVKSLAQDFLDTQGTYVFEDAERMLFPRDEKTLHPLIENIMKVQRQNKKDRLARQRNQTITIRSARPYWDGLGDSTDGNEGSDDDSYNDGSGGDNSSIDGTSDHEDEPLKKKRRRKSFENRAYHSHHPEAEESMTNRIYNTRGNAQPGMPVLLSTEQDDMILNFQPRSERRMTMIESSSRTQMQVPKNGEAERQLRVNVPVVRHQSLSRGSHHTAMPITRAIPPSSEPLAHSVSDETNNHNRRMADFSELYALDQLSERDMDSDPIANIVGASRAALSGYTSMCAELRCQPTPPRGSSVLEQHSSNQPNPRNQCDGYTSHALGTSDEPTEIKLPTSGDSLYGVMDLTQGDEPKIYFDGGNHCVVQVEAAHHTLQKVIDFLFDEHKVCQRKMERAHPIYRRDHTVRHKFVTELIAKLREDNSVWLPDLP